MVKRSLFIFATVLTLCSCEVIDENARFLPLPEAGQTRTHVLLEYTGFRCVNCPAAAETANALKDIYGERLIVVALHPASNPFTQGKYDYTCPAADSCYQFMGGTETTPFPTGNIDILPIGGSYFIAPTEWASRINKLITDSVAPNIKTVEAEYISASREIHVTCSVPDITHACRLAVWLTEDSVAGVQAMPDGTVNKEYHHRHLLRATAFDSPWGIALAQNSASAVIAMPEGCNIRKCSLVVLLLDANDYHILNGYETKMDYIE